MYKSNVMETDPDKREALASWLEPHNIKTLRTFLGFTGYYRQFVKDYAKIVRPMNDLLVGHSTNKDAAQKKKRRKMQSHGNGVLLSKMHFKH